MTEIEQRFHERVPNILRSIEESLENIDNGARENFLSNVPEQLSQISMLLERIPTTKELAAIAAMHAALGNPELCREIMTSNKNMGDFYQSLSSFASAAADVLVKELNWD